MSPTDIEKTSDSDFRAKPDECHAKIQDKKTVLNLLGMEGLIEADMVDANLLNALIEDLLVMPAHLNGKDIYLPGPAFGLSRLPVYVFSSKSKSRPTCKTLTDIIESDGLSLNAARNIILLDMFNQINDAKILITDGNYSETYKLILAIEYRLNLIKVYYGNWGHYQEIESNIAALKRKMEIENNIFHV